MKSIVTEGYFYEIVMQINISETSRRLSAEGPL